MVSFSFLLYRHISISIIWYQSFRMCYEISLVVMDAWSWWSTYGTHTKTHIFVNKHTCMIKKNITLCSFVEKDSPTVLANGIDRQFLNQNLSLFFRTFVLVHVHTWMLHFIRKFYLHCFPDQHNLWKLVPYYTICKYKYIVGFYCRGLEDNVQGLNMK